MPRDKRRKANVRHNPLGNDIDKIEEDSNNVRTVPHKKIHRGAANEEESEFLDAKMSEKIMQEAKAHQEEIEREDAKEKASSKLIFGAPKSTKKIVFSMGEDDGDVSGDESDYDDNYDVDYAQFADEGEAALVEQFLNPGPARNFGDAIREKLELLESDMNTPETESKISPKVVQVYRQVAGLLRRYKAGKLPKAFKWLPKLENWDEVMDITCPHEWSANAMFAATKMFSSTGSPEMAQRFYTLYLLPALRQDFLENKKINYHHYQAIKKALYKPKAFFKGLLLPLCEGGDCTLREAHIIGSVLSKCSIPVDHAASSLVKLCEYPYSGSTSIFIRILVNKKYRLHYRVIDTLVEHFMRFMQEERTMPVIWHLSLLTFAQRYKNSITHEQKEAFKPLLKKHFHHLITPEIRREMFSSVSRGESAEVTSQVAGTFMKEQDDMLL
eukprot:TRINITY_DN1668_c0_g6_i1.p1 TRINITY_DN1668_c0_g6~~TRINITY_DN1668_c0_g6_i1.p1  ORF type:complete len:442 (+),score=152.38 TRINITY_DN1668_c0_g6_i1:105-1430(+)